jgi:signal transduction histidine kinase
MKILVADDDPVARRLVGAKLCEWGFEVISVAGGPEAWEVLRSRNGPDLAILDWEMPEMNGLDLCRLVRAEGREPYVYLLLLTARSETTDLVQALDAGADDFVSKPFDVAELRARLRVGERVVGHIRGRRQLEIRLEHAHKLEAVGRLAAGVAHEINSPLQFLGDNLNFLRDAFDESLDLVATWQRLCESRAPELAPALTAAAVEADLGYKEEQVPRIVEKSLEGLQRIAKIVAAMKTFAPTDGEGELVEVDVNECIETAMTLTAYRFRDAASVTLEEGDVPRVRGHGGDIGQVVLSVLVNAFEAVAEMHGRTGRRGAVTVVTSSEAGSVTIAVRDTGGGIPPEIRHRVYDPFFTTKDIGAAMGHGLAIAQAVVVAQHGGDLWFETEVGVGTTFFVRLPCRGVSRDPSKRWSTGPDGIPLIHAQ